MKKEDTPTKDNETHKEHSQAHADSSTDNKGIDSDQKQPENTENNNADDNDDIKAEHNSSEDKILTEEEKLKQEVDHQKDKYLRLFAEFENYKRRTSKERLDLFKTASQELMQAMLPVLDDFDRALKEINKSEDDNLIQGVELISNKLRETLKSKGLEPMSVKEGDNFDADIHEAVTQIPAPDKSMKGKIMDVVERGYTLGDKIIRFPKVVTGK